MSTLVYTQIQHEFRKKNKLSCNEYVLIDMVYQLHVSSDSEFPGWCYMKREQMAEELGISKQGLLNMIDKLIESGFLIKNSETKFLKTSDKWNPSPFYGKQSLPEVNKVDVNKIGKESLPSVKKVVEKKQSVPAVKKVANLGKESVPERGKESLPYNNKRDNNINNKKTSKKSATEIAPVDSAYVEYIPEEIFADPEDTPVIRKEVSPAGKFDAEKVQLPFSGQDFADAWLLWCKHRKERKKKLTETAVSLQLRMLSKEPEAIAAAMVIQAIEKNWEGIFPLNAAHPLLKLKNPGKTVETAYAIRKATDELEKQGVFRTYDERNQ